MIKENLHAVAETAVVVTTRVVIPVVLMRAGVEAGFIGADLNTVASKEMDGYKALGGLLMLWIVAPAVITAGFLGMFPYPNSFSRLVGATDVDISPQNDQNRKS